MDLPEELPGKIIEDLASAVDSGMRRHVDILARLVAVPGIAWPGFDPEPLRESARQVRKLLLEAGFPDAAIHSAGPGNTAGGPAVLARRPAAEGMPTVLLYAHHDVQPVGAVDQWRTDPFVLTWSGGRLWGRGAADDKAGILIHLAALRAVDQVAGAHSGLGLIIFIEGGEESGSPTLRALLDQARQQLAADVAIVADSGGWRIGTPALTISLRGLVDGTVEVRVLDHALHSGTYGGPVPDALMVLFRLMATFHAQDGSVSVEGLLCEDAEGPELSESSFRADAGVPAGLELTGKGSLTSRLWTKPALSFIGLDAPPVGTAANTLLPSARVKFSLRLPSGNEPREAMEAMRWHALEHVPFGAEVKFTPGSMSMPFRVERESAMAAKALWALGKAWGTQAVRMGAGGSFPFVAEPSERFPRCAILITGAEDPDSRAHGPNESVHLGELRNAILAEALFLASLSKKP